MCSSAICRPISRTSGWRRRSTRSAWCLSAAIARDPATGARLRYGFVDIATEKAAKAAIAGLNGTQLDGSKLSVQLSGEACQEGARRRSSPAAAFYRPARRMPPRDGEPAPTFPAAPRPQPTFQVERRPLRPLIRRADAGSDITSPT